MEIYKNNEMVSYVNAMESEGHQWIIYNYGALLWFALDMKIIEDTDGQVSIDNVMGTIHERYNHYKGQIGYTELINIITEVTGNDYSDFFDSYLYGRDFLDLDYYFQDDDNDGVFNYFEIMFGDRDNINTIIKENEEYNNKNNVNKLIDKTRTGGI